MRFDEIKVKRKQPSAGQQKEVGGLVVTVVGFFSLCPKLEVFNSAGSAQFILLTSQRLYLKVVQGAQTRGDWTTTGWRNGGFRVELEEEVKSEGVEVGGGGM